MKTHNGNITQLEPNQVFVFGSNLSGFHGAGAAGFASFGEFGNVWRKYDYANKPVGWRGRWNIKGQGEGYQVGTLGASYALPTVTKAGKKRSRTIAEIKRSVEVFYYWARHNPELEFLVAYSLKTNLNGYSPDEMAYVFAVDIPDKVIFETEFSKLIEGKQ